MKITKKTIGTGIASGLLIAELFTPACAHKPELPLNPPYVSHISGEESYRQYLLQIKPAYECKIEFTTDEVVKYAEEHLGIKSHVHYTDSLLDSDKNHYWMWVIQNKNCPSEHTYKADVVIQKFGEEDPRILINKYPDIIPSNLLELANWEKFVEEKDFVAYRYDYGDFGITQDTIHHVTIFWSGKPTLRKIGDILHHDFHAMTGMEGWPIDEYPILKESAGAFEEFMGVEMFILNKYGKDSEQYKLAKKHYEDNKQWFGTVKKYVNELNAICKSDMPEIVKSYKRKFLWHGVNDELGVFNNAYLTDLSTFSEFDLMENIFLKNNSDMKKLLEILKNTPVGNEEKAMEYLYGFVK